ncbi:MAG: hypothetical protein H6817_04020 [Phycisphaerales bacterium]|nr:hypothetical protein [Phycisphaerales bacterium]
MQLCAGDDVDDPESQSIIPGTERISEIGQELRQLGDWDEMYQNAEPGIDSFWESRGWDDEADLFALQTVKETAAIPPWEFNNRINHVLDAVRDRYDLSDEQFRDVQSKAYGLIGAMAWRHGGTVFNQAREAVQTRTQHKPFTPEQVARWTEQTNKLFRELRGQFERVATEVEQSLTPEQRDIFERDFASYHRRMQAVEELRKKWEEGGWQPEDWALQNDPIHRPLVEQQQAAAQQYDLAQFERELSGPHDPLNESTWARYVHWFIRHYELDASQATAAFSILHELEQRAADYRQVHREEIADAETDGGTDHPVYLPIEKLFEELKRRLHPIPTQAQRHRANTPLPPNVREGAGNRRTVDKAPPE